MESASPGRQFGTDPFSPILDGNAYNSKYRLIDCRGCSGRDTSRRQAKVHKGGHAASDEKVLITPLGM
jgi:hypothetical protein